jgi:hypothetical protein
MKLNWSRRELEALGEPINPVLPTKTERKAGGGGKGSAPPAPDYKSAAEAQGKSSIEAIKAQTAANRPDIYTPFGNQTWTNNRTFDQAGYDAAMADYNNQMSKATPSSRRWVDGGSSGGDSDMSYGGYWEETPGHSPNIQAPDRNKYYGEDKWTQTTQLAPDAQAALDSQLEMQRGRSDLANGLMPQVAEAINKPLDWDSFQSMGSAPTASAFSFAGAAPTLDRANNAPNLLHNLNTIGLYDQGEFRANGLPEVGQLNKNGIPGMPTYDGKFVQDIQNQALNFMAPDVQQRQSGLEAKLAAQGVTPGSAAYNNAMRQFNDQQSRDKYQALNVAMNQAQGMFNSGLAANAQGFGQNRDIFNSQLASNQNAFNQQNQSWQNNYNLDNMQFNQRLTEHNFANQAMQNQNSMNLANLGFNNQSALAQNSAALQNQGFNNQLMQNQFSQQQAIADYQNKQRQQQIAEAQMRQLQPLNNINALLTGQQVGMPQMPSFNTAGAAQPVNYLGAANAQGNYQMQAAQMDNASANSLLGGAFGLGGQLGAASIMSFSDRRLKVDIKRLSHIGSLGVYEYRYAGSKQKHIGFMADEVKKVYPKAVKRHANGYDMVDYSLIGA